MPSLSRYPSQRHIVFGVLISPRDTATAAEGQGPSGRWWSARWTVLAFVFVLLGVGLRWIGLDRDVVDFVLPEQAVAGQDLAFYSFHPDETVLVSGALGFDDPLNPPYTMYGSLPLYLFRGAVGGLAWFDGPVAEDTVYRVGKILSAILSSLCMVAVWWLACLVFAPATAALAVLFLGVAPTAIQQAHYYTVDSLFCLVTTASLAAILHAVHRRSWLSTIMVGVLIGCSASVRLNGLLLVPVLAAAHLMSEGSVPVAWRQRLREPRLWAAFGVVVAVMVALQPYLLFSPSLYWTVRGHLDFAHIMQIVGGSNAQLYTLQYLGTTPFLYQWTHLLPLGIGWPMTATTALGVLSAFRGLNWRKGVLLLWVGLYLVTAGPLFVKPVRYMLPIVPPILMLAADLCRCLWSAGSGRVRWGLRLAVLVVVTHAVVYGLAFVRVWTEEDSRIQAGRWIADHVPEGATIAVENGAFPMRPVIDSQCYKLRELGLSTLFVSRGHLLCQTTVGWLEDRLGQADYVAITDVNRLIHVSAAPEVLPVVASFYRHLTEGKLGYRLVQRIKVYPEFWGIRFDDDGAEHSFLGFDHPAVLLLRRDPKEAAGQAWAAWVDGLGAEPFNVDHLLVAGTAALSEGNHAAAQALFESSQDNSSSGALAGFLSALARGRSGQGGLESEDLVVHDMMALSLAELGLPDAALTVLRLLAREQSDDGCRTAGRYVTIAARMEELSYDEYAAEVLRLASGMCER